jgi:hypothetical protein
MVGKQVPYDQDNSIHWDKVLTNLLRRLTTGTQAGRMNALQLGEYLKQQSRLIGEILRQ